MTDAAALARAADGCDAIFHLAALYSYFRRDAEAMMRVNVEGTRSALAAAGERRLVLTSSAATCGPVPGRPADERDSPPDWELKVAYKRSKLESERLALAAAAAGRDVVVVNPTTPVGPGDRRPTPTGKMIRDVAAGRAPAYVRTHSAERRLGGGRGARPGARLRAGPRRGALPARRRGPLAARRVRHGGPGGRAAPAPRSGCPSTLATCRGLGRRPCARAVRARAEAARAGRGAAGPHTGELLRATRRARSSATARAPGARRCAKRWRI